MDRTAPPKGSVQVRFLSGTPPSFFTLPPSRRHACAVRPAGMAAGVAWAILWKHGLPTTDGRAGMSANRVNIRLARVEDAEMIGAFVRRLTREHVARDFPPQGRRFLQRALGTPRILEGMRGTCRYFVAEERGKCLASSPLATTIICSCYSSRKRPRARAGACPLGTCARGLSRGGIFGCLHCQRGAGAVPVYQRFGFVASGPVTTEHGVTRLPMTTR